MAQKKKNTTYTKKKAPMKVLVSITAALVIVMVALLIVVNGGSGSGVAQTFDNAPPTEEQPILGDEGAPVSIVEFGDYKCPACQSWDNEIFPQIQSDYIDNGNVSFSYYNYLGFGEESLLAALASRTIYEDNPEQFWDFHHELFQFAPGETVTVDSLLELAAEHAPDTDQEMLQDAIENGEALSEIENEAAIISDYEVTATPTILINDKLVEDPFNYSDIQAIIEDEIAAAGS